METSTEQETEENMGAQKSRRAEDQDSSYGKEMKNPAHWKE